MDDVDFSYCLTSQLESNIRFKLKSIKGWQSGELNPEQQIYISCQPYAENKPICLPVRSKYLLLSDKDWTELIEFPVLYSDLLLSTVMCLTIWRMDPKHAVPFASSTFSLFGKNKTFKQGSYKLLLWRDVEADGSSYTTTPSKTNGILNPRKQTDYRHHEELCEINRLEKVFRKYERGDLQKTDWLDKKVFDYFKVVEDSYFETATDVFLYITMPMFDFPLVFHEREYTYPNRVHLRPLESLMTVVFDPEIYQDNPVENKHRKLARSHRTGPLDRELKPNSKLRDELNALLRYPPSKILSDAEKDLIWRFRFYLTRDKKGLTKFLKSVIWDDTIECKQAVELLKIWISIDVEDALELLGPEFTDADVREFAVNQLRRADDLELQLYLLQLVQAIKFEGFELNCGNSPLVEFLIGRGLSSPVLGNYLHWYLMVECEDKINGRIFAKVAYQFLSKMVQTPEGVNRRNNLRQQGELIAKLAQLSKEFRGSKEARPKKVDKLRAFIADPKNGLLSFPPMSLPLDASIQITGLVAEKSNIFKSALLPLLLTFTCIDGTEYTVLLIINKIIFKTGDDMRQDQLIVQLISLMDRLLKKENLDLQLTPYRVLATGVDHGEIVIDIGMLQFIPSKTIASILSQNGNCITPYLANQDNQDNQDNQNNQSNQDNQSNEDHQSETVPKAVMDRYIRTGYCVLTYILGIGDRHLDNLLLTREGRIFHIDFGYILGRDPKPFPPPMKICREMVEVFGGSTSTQYFEFVSYLYIAYNILRKSANLVLNLIALMANSNISDILGEGDGLLKIEERFRLNVSDEEAIQFMQGLLSESIGSYFPQVMEQIHRVAQLFRT